MSEASNQWGWRWRQAVVGFAFSAVTVAASSVAGFKDYRLNFDSPTDPALQSTVEALDARLRERFGMTEAQTSVGVLDLKTLHLALVRADRVEYAASLPKIGILLAWFELEPEEALRPDPGVRHELGLMIKRSDNALATKYSQRLGLERIQTVLDCYGLYDAQRGGGLWMGKHYGKDSARRPDPVGGHTHAATVRQLLRFYLLMEQGRLVSPAASQAMRDIFATPDIEHNDEKFVRALASRNLTILRKTGWWQDWAHDTALVTGEGRHYLIAALTRHPKGDDYLRDFAIAVDDLLARGARSSP
jgi:beta-lactamase class A